jgi:hypothetical protein
VCHPTCRDRRPPREGDAAQVAALLDRKRIPPEAMTALLAEWQVDRFRDLCYSHASAILHGLRHGILEDDLRAHAARLDQDSP